MKRTIIIVVISLLVVVIVGAGVFMFISMNNTISALNAKLEEQQATQTTANPTPLPTENYSAQISELEVLYNQKLALIKQYSDTADELKSMYTDDDHFIDLYSVCSSKEVALELYNDRNEAEKYGTSPSVFIAAARAAYYTIYVQENQQILIQVDGLIDMLKSNYTDSNYMTIKNLLISIEKPEI